MPRHPFLVGLFLTLMLSGCLSRSLQHSYAEADRVAAEEGFSTHFLQAENFHVRAFTKFSEPGQDVTIYLEGDGAAWRSRYRLAEDPTPRRPLVLHLASLDPSANVAYLARPCQYVLQNGLGQECASHLWSNRRFSEGVIRTMDRAVDILKNQADAKGIHLVGYSGGAAVAILVAARRADILSLRTLAGNLDHQELSRFHQVSPLLGSLNPIDFAEEIENIPQQHFVGREDKIVPGILADRFLARQSLHRCSSIIHVPGASHRQGWREHWPSLLQQPFPCRNPGPSPGMELH